MGAEGRREEVAVAAPLLVALAALLVGAAGNLYPGEGESGGPEVDGEQRGGEGTPCQNGDTVGDPEPSLVGDGWTGSSLRPRVGREAADLGLLGLCSPRLAAPRPL